ncbi:MAG: tetratricopeptide repeat protein, partial [Bdellovibrionales bacterium]|nr:tetratricopeptide repeat protein [Bdellovibrionales bacterium]
KSVRTMINLAGVYRNQGDFHQAFTLAERAHSLYPDGAEPLFMMATIALENGEKGKMRSLLEETLQKAPTFVPALVALGRVCLNDKDFECAKATLEKAVNEEPRNVRALVSRYALAIANGDVVFARELEHRIEKLAIRDAEYFQLKSRFHIAIGHRS